MSEHKATVTWLRKTADFTYKTYDRTHTIQFGGGTMVTASAALEYLGKAELVNPEEMLVSALSSCHMLTVLAIASQQGFIIDSYRDEAIGVLGKNSQGKMAVTKVTLKPRIQFSGDKQPDGLALKKLHDKAHEACFIANSVTMEVTIEA